MTAVNVATKKHFEVFKKEVNKWVAQAKDLPRVVNY